MGDLVFLEYGGGTGFLSLLSKVLGVGTVIYSDIYNVSCKDAKEIAQTLGYQANYYIEGGIDELVEFFSSAKLVADSIASYDVLEHIYDIDDFCTKLYGICHKGTTMMHASGANIFFYPYVKSVQKKQKEIETRDREEEWGHKQRDCTLAYLGERKKIIMEYSPSLSENEIAMLASNSRGLIKDDILKFVDRYIECGESSKLIEHPTNTCDPHTGNWAEHLMNPYYLQEALSINGFEVTVLPGYWGNPNSFLKSAIANILNRAIRIFSTQISLYICPYYSIFAKYNGQFSGEIHRHHIYKCRRLPLWYVVQAIYELLSHFRQP